MLILYIDDDLDDFEIFTAALAEIDRGVTVIYAANGDEGFEVLNRKLITLPDIIFLDINMPGIDGLTFLTELRADEKLKHIPVVVLSTSSNPREIRHAEQLSAKFITKHTEFGKLVEAISLVIK
jgi:CheY-like chemotaxis protein